MGSAIILMARSLDMHDSAQLKVYFATQPLAIKMMALPSDSNPLEPGLLNETGMGVICLQSNNSGIRVTVTQGK